MTVCNSDIGNFYKAVYAPGLFLQPAARKKFNAPRTAQRRVEREQSATATRRNAEILADREGQTQLRAAQAQRRTDLQRLSVNAGGSRSDTGLLQPVNQAVTTLLGG